MSHSVIMDATFESSLLFLGGEFEILAIGSGNYPDSRSYSMALSDLGKDIVSQTYDFSSPLKKKLMASHHLN